MTIELTEEEVQVLRQLLHHVISNLNATDKLRTDTGRKPLYAKRIEQRRALLEKLKA